MKKKILGIRLALLPLLAACDNDDSSNNPYNPVNFPTTTRGCVSDVNNFAFKITRMATKNTEDEANVIVSPQSLFSVLAMVANGQNQEERAALLDYLTDGSKNVEELNAFCNALRTQLPKLDKQTVYKEANSIWFTPSQKVLTEFSRNVSDWYGADLFNSYEKNDKGLQEINSWVSSNTSGLITNYLDEPPRFAPIVVNALYFKSEWKEKFPKDRTADAIFTNAGGDKVSVPFMNNVLDCPYYSNEKYEMGVLPYGNSNFEMCVVHPFADQNFAEFVASFDAEEFSEAYLMSGYAKVTVALPKFKVDSSGSLFNIASELGLDEIYASEMVANEKIKFEYFTQSVRLEVDEDGTTVAVASSSTAPTAPAPATLKVDSPFIYIIRERSSGVILIMGTISKF
ncbi:MAG: serpin family protein [Bacteroidales bacterium]|nr:serpin family protein [Bacteroidales bacterium]